MIANRNLSKRERREIAARSSLSIRIDSLSNGEYRATLTEEACPQDKEIYVSACQPSMAEALSLAEYEMHQLVSKRVDALEADDFLQALHGCVTPADRAEVMDEYGMNPEAARKLIEAKP
jgi:hypothetical protein